MEYHVIPHSRPTLGDEEIAAVSDVIRSGHIAQGEKVAEFEERLAVFIGVKGAVAVNSGTSAIHLGLMAMGVSSGDDIMLPSFVCSAPLNAIYQLNASPLFCDIEPESFNISIESIKDNIKDSVRAVIVPHMFGSPADIAEIEELGVPLVEDCAHSIGALYGDKKAGSIGRFSIISFYGNKMLACGEGGAVLSNDEDILDLARDRRDYDEKESYKMRYNYKMTDMQAALGVVQLGKLNNMIEKRKKIAAVYNKAFGEIKGIILPRGEFDHIYYRYAIRVKKELNDLIKFMKEKGVDCSRPVYKPLHRYLELRLGFKNTDEIYSSTLSIPIYPSLQKEEQQRVIDSIKEYFS